MGCTPSTQAVRSGSASPQERMVGASKPPPLKSPPKVHKNIAALPSESKKNGVDHKKTEDKKDEHKKEKKKKKKKKHSAGSHRSRKSSSSSSSSSEEEDQNRNIHVTKITTVIHVNQT